MYLSTELFYEHFLYSIIKTVKRYIKLIFTKFYFCGLPTKFYLFPYYSCHYLTIINITFFWQRINITWLVFYKSGDSGKNTWMLLKFMRRILVLNFKCSLSWVLPSVPKKISASIFILSHLSLPTHTQNSINYLMISWP